MENAGSEKSSWTFIFVGISVLVITQIFFYIRKLMCKETGKKNIAVKNEAALDKVKEKHSSSTTSSTPASGPLHHHNNKQHKQPKKHQSGAWKNKSGFTHPLLATNLMGHTSKIMDLDCTSDGKYLVTCAEDRSVFFWDLRDVEGKGKKSVRVNIEYDHATHIAWSPDGKAYVIHKGVENCIEVYKIDKKKDGLPAHTVKANTFEKVHMEDTIGFGIALNGRFMMSCSSKNDLLIWNLKGDQLAKVDTYLMNTMRAKISPCGRYVVASGFVGDVKVWEVLFDKSGDFKQVVRAFELTGHTSGVYDFAFSAGTCHIATVSKDGTWKLYDTNVNYARGEIVQQMQQGSYSQGANPSLIALSPRGDTLVIATYNYLEVFNATTGTLSQTIPDVFADEVTCMKYDPMGKYLFVCGDRCIRVFTNVKG